MSTPNKRVNTDIMKLSMNYKVDLIDNDMHKFFVVFHGPKESPYEEGVWKVKVELNDEHPYRPPTVFFVNKIYHPNINEESGAVCLDVISQQWSPMFDLVNVFEIFLPQLLLYPNPSDPSNGDAGALMLSDLSAYEQKVKEYCQRYAKPEDAGVVPDEKSGDEKLTEDGSSPSDEEVAGTADP